MFENLQYLRKIKRMEEDVQFLEAVVDGEREREEELKSLIRTTKYQLERAQKRLDEAIAVLKAGRELCDLCENRECETCRNDCKECVETCMCKFCEAGSGFEFKERSAKREGDMI